MLYTLFLFIVTALIWGSTWIAIHWELGVVSPYWSIIYRFAIAAVILLLYCVLSRKKMRFSSRDHLAFFIQGLLLFSTSYILYYTGLQYLVSGLASVLYAAMVMMNIINARIFFKTPLESKVILGAILGLAGLVVVFSDTFISLNHHASSEVSKTLMGALICLTGTLIASFGNMASHYNQRRKLPILQTNAYGMLYGTLVVLAITLSMRIPMTFDFRPLYIGNLIYLAIIGSIIGFGAYLQLLQRIGPGKAAYVFVVLPIISLIISTIFESFRWTSTTFIGLALVMLGNILILMSGKKRVKTEQEVMEAG